MKPDRVKRTVISLIAVASAAALLAACGSSSKQSSTKTTSSSATSTASSGSKTASTPAGPTGAPIKLGSICDCTGPQASVLGQEGKVIQAWANDVNSKGGLNGHRVQVINYDAGQDPAKALQDAKQLIENDHVPAIIDYTLADAAFAKYAAQKGVPVIGGVSQDAAFLSNPDFFPTGTQLIVLTVGTFAVAKQHGIKKIGVLYCAESPICAELIPLAQTSAKIFGLQVTAQKVSSTAPSYTAPCLAMKSAGVDGLFAAVAAPLVPRITDACAQQGYKPTTTNQTTTTSGTWLHDPNLEGALLSGPTANPYDTATPAVAEFQAAMNKSYPGFTTSPSFNANLVDNWLGGELFAAAGKAANIGPASTAADVKKGLYALKNETLGGLTSPLNYTPGKPAFIPCYFSVTVKSGKFESLNGNKPICLTTTQTSALLKALHLG